MQVWTFFLFPEYTKETQGRIAKKEKTMRLNIGSGYWSVLCAEEETPGRFSGRWCHCSPSLCLSQLWRPKQSGQSRGQGGKPGVTKMGWRIRIPWPLLYTRMPGRSPVLKRMTASKKKKPGAKGWCHVCAQVQSSNKFWTLKLIKAAVFWFILVSTLSCFK